jgi:hypothetical protein
MRRTRHVTVDGQLPSYGTTGAAGSLQCAKSLRTAPGTGAAATSLPAPPAAGAALPAAEAGSNLTCLSAMMGVHSTTCNSEGPCGRNTCGQRHECVCSVDEHLHGGNGWLPWHVPWWRAAVHAGAAKATQYERQRHCLPRHHWPTSCVLGRRPTQLSTLASAAPWAQGGKPYHKGSAGCALRCNVCYVYRAGPREYDSALQVCKLP